MRATAKDQIPAILPRILSYVGKGNSEKIRESGRMSYPTALSLLGSKNEV